jgi:hypothetical protein
MVEVFGITISVEVYGSKYFILDHMGTTTLLKLGGYVFTTFVILENFDYTPIILLTKSFILTM